MKNMKKILAILIAVIMVMCLGACSKAPRTATAQWSYKTDKTQYAIGVHIYSLVSAYNQAFSVIQNAQGEEFDAEASILDIESSFDETGEVFLCKDWIMKEADYITKNLIAIDNLMEEYGVELDESVEASALEQAKKDWDLGPYYEEYLSYGYAATPYKTILEPCGISFESFYQATYLASVKQNAIFDKLYNKGGIKAVAEDEMKKFFEDNYTNYSYFTVNFYESSVDPTTNETVNTPFDAKKTAEIKENLEFYVSMIKNGTTYEDVSGAYTAYAKLQYNPSVSNIENLDNTTLPAEVAEVLKGLKDGEAKVAYFGQEDTQMAYFLYKKPITAETKGYIANETNYDALLKEMRNEEFLADLEKITEQVVCEINTKEVEKYTPQLIESFM